MKTKAYAKCLAIGSGLSALAFSFIACGDDVTKVTQETSGLEIVASADSLGKCTEKISGEMKFVSKENAVYVCADSSWKNVSAVENVSCSAETLKDSSGYKIVCGGDSVGVVFNGKNGEKGEVGKAGTSCTVTESPLLDSDFGGGYLVICGSDTVGMLVSGRNGENCTLTDNGDGSVTQVCGASEVTLYKGFCGGKPFDPDSSRCIDDEIVSVCGENTFDPTESFCVDDVGVYSLCDGKTYDPEKVFCDARNGKLYKFVFIGDQIWMAENLNYADSLKKTVGGDSSSFCYDNDPENCEKYGRLYLWSTAMDSAAIFSEDGKDCGKGTTCSLANNAVVRGICPEGWWLPNADDWQELETYVAGQVEGGLEFAGDALKSTEDWNDDGNGSDVFGFNALPAGFCSATGVCKDVGNVTIFLSSSENDSTGLFIGRRLLKTTSYIKENQELKNFAYSIRCVQPLLK